MNEVLLFAAGAFVGVVAGMALAAIFSANHRGERDDEGAQP